MTMFHRIIIALSILAGTPLVALAQGSPSDIVNSSNNQGSLLPRIYASDVTISSEANNHHITGSFAIRNSETTTVGNLQYEIMLLDPLQDAPVGQLVADTPNVYDRVRTQEILTLKAGEKRTIQFSYDAPNVPQASYRIRIQIVTTNDRKLGWDDTTVTLGGATGFIIVQPLHVNVASSDPITKEQNTTWDPLYGVDVNPLQSISFSASLKNPGNQSVSGTIQISTKKLLYANQTPIISKSIQVSVPANGSKDVTIPVTTQGAPGAYIILITAKDAHGNQVSGVGEYRYVVRGESASVASLQIATIPKIAGELAQVNFVLGGSADRATPISGTMKISVTDSQGEAGSITKPFSMSEANPITGNASVSMTRTLCGTPLVTLELTSSSGTRLDTYSTSAPAFANPSCKPPIFTRPVINILVIGAIVALLVAIWQLRKK